MVKVAIGFVSELLAIIVITVIVVMAIAWIRNFLIIEQASCYWDGLLRYEYCNTINRAADFLRIFGLY